MLDMPRVGLVAIYIDYHLKRGTVIAVGRSLQVLITPLRGINLPSIRPFNQLSNGVSHMQIGAAVLEIQRL